MDLHISISARRVVTLLLLLIVPMTALGVAALVYRLYLNRSRFAAVVEVFEIGQEGTIQNWYAVCLLLLCAAFLALAARLERRTHGPYPWHWAGMAVVFLVFSLEEELDLHIRATPFLRSALHAGGIFYWAWVIPGALFVLIFALVYAPLLRALPAPIRSLLIAGGAIFVAGALGLEFAEGYFFTVTQDPRIDAWLTLVEEVMEMIGVLLLLYAVLLHLSSYLKELRITIRP